MPPVAFEKGGTLALLPFLTDTDTRPGANPYDDMRIDVLRKCKELPLSTLPPLREAIEAISRDRGSDSGLHQARNKEVSAEPNMLLNLLLDLLLSVLLDVLLNMLLTVLLNVLLNVAWRGVA